MTELFDRIREFLQNPIPARARSMKRAGESLQVTLPGGRIITAIAAQDISSSQILAAKTTQGKWYALSKTARRIINERTETSRNRPRRIEVVEEIFIVVIYEDQRYSDEKIILPFSILDFQSELYFTSYLVTQERSRLLLAGAPSLNPDDQSLNIYYFDSNGLFETVSETDLLYYELVNNLNAFSSTDLMFSVNDRINLALLTDLNNTRDAWYLVIRDTEGVSDVYNELILPTLAYTGTPANTYIYNTLQNNQPVQEQVIIDRGSNLNLDGRFVAGKLIYFEPLIFDGGVDLEYYAWENSLDVGMFAVDAIVNPVLGQGHLRTDSLRQTAINNTWDINYNYSNASDPDIDYSYLDREQMNYSYEIIANNTTADPNLSGSNYDFRATCTAKEILQETFSSTEFGYRIDFAPNAIAPTTGNYTQTTRTEYDKSVVQRRQQTYNSQGTGVNQQYFNEDVTMSLDIDWRVRRTDSTDINFTGQFNFGSMLLPVNYSIFLDCLFDYTTTTNIVGTHTEGNPLQAQVAMNTSTAPQIFPIPEGTDPTTVSIITDNGTIGQPLFFAGSNGSVFDLNEDDVFISSTANVSLDFVKVMTTNDSQALINRTRGKISVTYGTRLKFRKQLNTIFFAASTINKESQAVLEDASYSVFDFSFIPRDLRNPWDDLTGYNDLRTDLWFAEEVSRLSRYTVTTISTIINRQREYIGSLWEITGDFAGLELVNDLIFYDGVNQKTINTANSAYGAFNTVNINGSVITLTTRLHDNLGRMSPTPGLPTEWTEQTAVEWNGIQFVSTVNNAVENTIPRSTPADFIGEEFLIYDRDNTALITAVLNSAIASGTFFDLTLSLIESIPIQAGTFWSRNNSDSIIVTKANLSAMFLAGRAENLQPEKRLTINGNTIILAYAERDDADPTNFTTGWVHKFTIQGNNVIFSGELQHRIFEPFDGSNPKSNGTFRQVTEKLT